MTTTRCILAGNLIDGSGTATRRRVFLRAEDGIITAVGPMTALPASTDVRIDDLSHCTIVAPLVDCSVALASSPAVGTRMRNAAMADAEANARLINRHLADCHNHGVLGVADSSGQGTWERSPATQPPSPVIVRSGQRIAGKDDLAGHGGQFDFLRIGFCADIESMDPFTTRFGTAELRALLLPNGQGKKIIVANGPQAVAEALAAGCDAIEQGYAMGEENVRVMAARQVVWIPSLLRTKNGMDGSASGGDVCCRFSLRFVAPGKPIPGAEAYWKAMLTQQLAQLRLARSLGVPTVLGTGAGGMGILHGESMVEEMKLFLKAGYTLEETLHCASEVGARFFGMDGLGALTVGRPATFLVTRGTPQQLPRKLSYLENIYIDGRPSAAYRKNPVKVGRSG